MKTRILFNFIALLLITAGCSKSTDTTTSPIVGSIITSIANSVNDSVTVTGTFSNSGTTVIESGICYDTAASPDLTKSKLVNTIQNGTFSCTIKNPGSGIQYFARAYVSTASGTTYGNDIGFIQSRAATPVGVSYYFNDKISTLCADAAGNIYVGGSFKNVSKWNGTAWNILLYSNAAIESISSDASGNIIAGATRGLEYYVTKWNGSLWSDVGTYNFNSYFITGTCSGPGGNVYAIGSKKNAAGKYYVAKWGPGGYSELGAFDDFPNSICTDAAGNLYAGGLMNHGANNFYVAKWNGSTWSELGNFNSIISSLCMDKNGNLIVSGAFKNSSGKYYVGRWNGTSWSELGTLNLPYDSYSTNYVTKLHADALGNIYGLSNYKYPNGKYAVLKWDGNTWNKYVEVNALVYAICTNAAGHVYLGGELKNASGSWYVAEVNF